MSPVAPMPWGAAVDTNGLKSRVTLFSGELSMTSVAPVPEAAEVSEVGGLLDEQAASPAARGPAATKASTLLLDIGLIVNFDCPLGGYLRLSSRQIFRGGGFSFLGDPFYFWGRWNRASVVSVTGVQQKARPRVTGGPSHCAAGYPAYVFLVVFPVMLRGRLEVQQDVLVGAGAGTVVGTRRLARVVRVRLGRPAGVVRRGVLAPLGRGRRRDDRQLGGDGGLDRGEVRGLLGDRLVAVQLVQVRGHRRVVELLVVTVAGTDQRRAEPAVVEVERGDATAAPAEQQREGTVGSVRVVGGGGGVVERGLDAGLVQLGDRELNVVRVVAVGTRRGDRDVDFLAVQREEPGAVLLVAGRRQDRRRLGGVAGGRKVVARQRRGEPRAERRLGDAGGVQDRGLQAGLALGADRGAVKRHVDRLADRQLVGRELAQVRVQGVGGVRALERVVGRRVLLDEVLLQVRDVVTGPVDLPGEQGALRGGVRRVNREVDLGHRHRAAPVVRPGGHREALVGVVPEGVRAGADGGRVGVGGRVADAGPDRLRDDRLAADVLQVHVLRGGERQRHVVTGRGDAGGREAAEVDVVGPAGVGRDVLVREGDVGRRQRGAVAPLHALADREGDRLAAVAPGVAGGQPVVRLHGRVRQVELEQRLVDETGGTHAVDRRAADKRVEVLGDAGLRRGFHHQCGCIGGGGAGGGA